MIIIVALLSFAALSRTFHSVERPANEPFPSPGVTPRDMRGWIAFGTNKGLWAVDPTRPSDPKGRIQLTDRPGVSRLTWSSDGSKLLIRRLWVEYGLQYNRHWSGLFVVNADGTETRLVVDSLPEHESPSPNDGWIEQQASFSPDGTQVVYADLKADGSSGIYVIDSDGGTPQLIHSTDRELSNPTFSTNGTQMAYFEGMGDYGNSLRVMNADGTGVRVLGKVDLFPGSLGWSPDGSRLFFVAIGPPGISRIWVVRADGSDLTRVAGGADPSLSPDGSLLIFSRGRRIFMVGADGSGLREIGKGTAPSWSPDGLRIAFLRKSWLQIPSPLYPDILHVHRGYSLFTMAADGSDVEKVLRIYPEDVSAPAVAWKRAG